LVFGERKKTPWSEPGKPYATSSTTAYQLGAKIRFSPNKCGSQATLTDKERKRTKSIKKKEVFNLFNSNLLTHQKHVT